MSDDLARRGPGAPHRRYQFDVSTLLTEELERQREDPDPLDPTEDLLLARTVAAVAIRKAAAELDAGDSPDLGDLLKQLTSVARLSDGMHARRHADRISRAELDRIVDAMVQVVELHAEPEVVERIIEGWQRIERPGGS